MVSAVAKILAVSLWAASIAIGLFLVERRENLPGAAAPAECAWPKDSSLALDPLRPTLIIFVHPHCPCSRASIHELESLLQQCNTQPKTYVLSVLPFGAPEGWAHTDLTETIAHIPNIIAASDIDAREATRFHALTSGQALLFSPTGQQLFAGGITASRGQDGENPGEQSIVSLVNHGYPLILNTAVFGCSLTGQNAFSQQGVAACPRPPTPR